MKRRQSFLAIACFSVLVILGLGFASLGLVFRAMIPGRLVDIVVEPRDIANVQRRDDVRAILTKGWGRAGLIWGSFGLLVVSISGPGLWAQCRIGLAEEGA